MLLSMTLRKMHRMLAFSRSHKSLTAFRAKEILRTRKVMRPMMKTAIIKSVIAKTVKSLKMRGKRNSRSMMAVIRFMFLHTSLLIGTSSE